MPLHFRRGGDPGQVEKQRGKVDIKDHVGIDRAGFGHGRVAQYEGHTERLLIHEPLVVPAMITEEKALIRGVDHHGVFGQVMLIKEIEQASDIIVDTGDNAQILLDILLINPTTQLPLRQLMGNLAFEIGNGHIFVETHFGLTRGGGATDVIVMQGWRLGDILIQVEVGVLLIGIPGTVRRLVVDHHTEGAAGITFIEPVEAHICDQVSDITATGLPGAAVRAIENKLRVVVAPLAGENGPVVETGRAMFGTLAEVPLAENGGLVACGLQQLGVSGKAIIERGGERGGPIDVVIGAGQDCGAAGGADGVGTETIVKPDTAVGDAVEVGRFIDAAAIAAHGVRRVVIGHDEDDVGWC